MKKNKMIVLLLAVLLVFAGCTSTTADNDNDKITVAVSIVPEATFVEAVAGDLVNIVTVIPVGNSPANYQPTTMEMQAISDADIYFVVQVPTEEANILPKIYDFNEDIVLVNLRDATAEVYPLRHLEEHSHGEDEHDEDEHDEDEHDEDEHDEDEHDEDEHDEDEHDEEGIDPHIWLSPKRVAVMVQKIADELSALDKANEEIYQTNAQAYIKEINELDEEVKNIIDDMDNKSFMIYHGAYGYFADDYGLNMISLEADGKAATAAKMQDVIDEANDAGIVVIFYQDEFDDSQAATVAEEIGGTVQRTAPLSGEYINGIMDFANALANGGE